MTKARSNATAEAAKGDLRVGSGTNLSNILAVGADGTTIVADSAATTGLRYSATPSASNPILNSNFNIWQRGTSIAATGGSGVYTADRWSCYNASYTVSQQDTSDTTNLPFISKCARVIRRVGETSVAGVNFVQPLETVNTKPFIGKTATLSFYARAGANYSSTSSALAVYLLGGTGTDQNPNNTYTGQSLVITQTATLTTTWQRFTYTTSGAIATSVNELAVQFTSIGVGTAGAADYFEVTGVQLDIGSVALPYRTYAATIQGELAACQRYYVRFDGASYAVSGYGTFTSATNAVIMTPLPSTMRIAPSAVDWGTLSVFEYSAAFTPSAVTMDTSYTNPKVAAVNATITGATAGRSAFFRTSGSTAGFIGYSAEL